MDTDQAKKTAGYRLLQGMANAIELAKRDDDVEEAVVDQMHILLGETALRLGYMSHVWAKKN